MRKGVSSILLVLFGFLSKSAAQTGNVSGVVMDVYRKEPLPFVMITLLQDTTVVYKAQTDYDGKFNIKSIYTGYYRLQADYYMFELAEKRITIIQDSTTTVKVDLKEMQCQCCYYDPPVCPKERHTDKIIEMYYGVPDEKTKRLAKRGKLCLGGKKERCEKYYCRKHKVRF